VRIELSTETADGHALLRFAVSDTGIGIEPSAQARIFERFTQADSSTTRHFGGTGLGLSISRSLVELMGGTIGFASTVGVGSRFSFILRLALAEGRRECEAESTSIAKLTAPFPILVADDNAINVKVIGSMLQSLGLSCEVAADGCEAVRNCLSRDYTAVLMDCQMPVMDGFEATRQIRAAGRTTLPIIAVTAAASDRDRKQAVAAGMDDFLTKPIRRAELAGVLARWLTQSVA